MRWSDAFRVVLGVALVVGIVALGGWVYQAGFAAGVASEIAGAPSGGFGIFGFLFFLFFLFVLFGLFRAAIGGRRGWGGRGWYGPGYGRGGYGPGGYGPGGPRFGPGHDHPGRESFDEWHRRMHEGDEGTSPPPPSS